jgi:hypothetical protein
VKWKDLKPLEPWTIPKIPPVEVDPQAIKPSDAALYKTLAIDSLKAAIVPKDDTGAYRLPTLPDHCTQNIFSTKADIKQPAVQAIIKRYKGQHWNTL